MLIPTVCPVCGRAGPAPCAPCIAALRPGPLLPPPDGVDRCVVVCAYTGTGRELVARLKYRNARAATKWLAGAMAALVEAEPFDVVTWVPTSAVRRRARGFDQAEVLARLVARRVRRPCRALLVRGNAPPQTGRPVDARRQGPPLALRGRTRPLGRVLLVDDVVTTGTTASVAARALRAGGAEQVVVVAAARTPLKRPPRRSEISA